MILETTFFLNVIISDPTTGEPIDADSPPDVDVYENDDDDPFLNIISVKRGTHTGNYSVKVEATTANGFNEGNSYSLVARAAVSGITGKAVISNFIINDMNTTLEVAKDLVIPLQEDFIPDMGSVEPPIEPPSLESLFGPDSGAPEEVKALFARWYDQVTHTWNPQGDVPGDIQGDVLIAYTAIQIYQAAKKVYDDEYNLQKAVQWKVKCADKMIEFVGP